MPGRVRSVQVRSGLVCYFVYCVYKYVYMLADKSAFAFICFANNMQTPHSSFSKIQVGGQVFLSSCIISEWGMLSCKDQLKWMPIARMLWTSIIKVYETSSIKYKRSRM